MPIRHLLLSVAVSTLPLITGCVDDESALDTREETSPIGPPPPTRLFPPQAYVQSGTTRLSLEDAGILRPIADDGRGWALVLGKALFWDQQAGSDGNACASCHFAAGADHRIRNQLSPGFHDHGVGPDGDSTFGSTHSDTGEVAAGRMPSGAVATANYTLTPADFPLLKLVDKTNRNSQIRTNTNDAVSSQGSFDQLFEVLGALGLADQCAPGGDVFSVTATNRTKIAARQVEPRNTPTTINSAFFHSNFWDGRANNLFNGVGVFGLRDIQGDPNKRLVVFEEGAARLDYLQVRNASLASQAVGPPLSALEMSCAGRTLADVGRKLLSTIPLIQQKVDITDSTLGPFANPFGRGLLPQHTYAALIARAFPEKYWNAPGRYRIVDGELVPDPEGYTQMELNFSMFWGLSIMIYEQTLVSDQSRFDDWFESCRPAVANPLGATSQAVPIANPTVSCNPIASNPNRSTDPTAHGLTAQEVLGFALFNNGGVGIRNAGSPACSGCHPVTGVNPLVFPTFSEAAFTATATNPTGTFVAVERSRVDDPGAFLPAVIEGGSHDRGFFNLGLRPASTDLGNGGLDPYGNPLSITRMFLREQAGSTAFIDPTGITNRCGTATLVEPGGTPCFPGCPLPANPGGPCPLSPPPTTPLDLVQERTLVDGSFKTPSIRNVGLTPPYFHYGGYSDLRSVVEVYARGGSKRDMRPGVENATGDWSGTGRLGNGLDANSIDFGSNVDFFIRDIKSTDQQIDAIVAFLLTATDPRVQCDRAPFDHPELKILNGHRRVDGDENGLADDETFLLPPVGAAGYVGGKAKYCIPNAGNLFAPGMEARRGGK